MRSCYAESKKMGETMCVAWQHQYGVPVKILRIFHTYGPGLALDDGRVFCDFVADLVGGRDLKLTSDGMAIRAYCYLGDAVAGYLAVLLKGKNEAYNVGNSRMAVSVRELAERLVALFPEKELRLRHTPPEYAAGHLHNGVSRICPDTSKLEALGWEPRHSIESGFRRTGWALAATDRLKPPAASRRASVVCRKRRFADHAFYADAAWCCSRFAGKRSGYRCRRGRVVGSWSCRTAQK